MHSYRNSYPKRAAGKSIEEMKKKKQKQKGMEKVTEGKDDQSNFIVIAVFPNGHSFSTL